MTHIIIQLRVTEEQERCIKAFLDLNGWGDALCGTTYDLHTCDETATAGLFAENLAPIVTRTLPHEPLPILHEPFITTNACPFCFMEPCVTANPQSWLGQGQQPRAGNNSVRKQKYRKFWNLLNNLGAWRNPSYIVKKANANQMQNGVTVFTLREIMPECVLKVVRGLYPNPAGVPYLGHKWY